MVIAQQEKQGGEAIRSRVDFVLVEDKNREKEEKEKGSKVNIVLVPKDNEKFQIREAERINEEKELTKPAWSILKFGFGALAVGEALALIGASAYAAPVIIAGVAGITVGSFLVTLWERDKIVEKIKSAFAYFSSKIKELNNPTVRATLSGFVGSLLSIDGVIRFISSVSLIPKLEIVAGVLALLYAAKEAGLIEKLESPKSNKEKKLEEEKQLQQPKNGETVWVDKFSDSGIVSTPIGNYPTTKKRPEEKKNKETQTQESSESILKKGIEELRQQLIEAKQQILAKDEYIKKLIEALGEKDDLIKKLEKELENTKKGKRENESQKEKQS